MLRSDNQHVQPYPDTLCSTSYITHSNGYQQRHHCKRRYGGSHYKNLLTNSDGISIWADGRNLQWNDVTHRKTGRFVSSHLHARQEVLPIRQLHSRVRHGFFFSASVVILKVVSNVGRVSREQAILSSPLQGQNKIRTKKTEEIRSAKQKGEACLGENEKNKKERKERGVGT